jgi:hypothetical protein
MPAELSSASCAAEMASQLELIDQVGRHPNAGPYKWADGITRAINPLASERTWGQVHL